MTFCSYLLQYKAVTEMSHLIRFPFGVLLLDVVEDVQQVQRYGLKPARKQKRELGTVARAFLQGVWTFTRQRYAA